MQILLELQQLGGIQMMTVIGLSAKMGCGKTTLCEMLMKLAPVDKAVRLAFGDVLKQECAEHFGFPLEWCYSQEGKERKVDIIGETTNGIGLKYLGTKTVRELLQLYGTDYRRAQDPLYWIKAMQAQLVTLQKQHADESLLVVVDDVRFPDEADACLANGYCFRIEPFPGWQPGPHAGHASEIALDEFTRFTFVYHPQHGLDSLRSVAEHIVWRVRG